MADNKLEYQFILEPDEALKCSICLEVARDQPMQHGGVCGRLFCKECIEKHGDKPFFKQLNYYYCHFISCQTISGL